MNAKNREEEYLRRMKALGYEPSLNGMDDEDIEWELAKMEGADRRREAEWQQPVYRPVDPGLKARILRMFGQPYDESAIPKGQEFYLNGWDNGEDEGEERNQVSQREQRKSDFNAPDFDPWKNAWKLDWGKDGNPLEGPQKMDHWPRHDGAMFPGREADYRPLSYAASGDDEGAGLQPMSENFAMHGPSKANTQLQDTFWENQTSPRTMEPSNKAVDLIGEIEGFRPVPYRGHDTDPLTIGYGHVILPGEDFSGGMTKEEARVLKLKDIKERVDQVNDWARMHNVKLTQQQFDALVSFHYNTGSIFEMEKLRDLIKSGNATPDEIRAAFGEYYNSKGKRMFGLWKRRMDEADMFLNGEYQQKVREMPKDIEFDNI